MSLTATPEIAVDNTEKQKIKEREQFRIFEQALDTCNPGSLTPITELEDNEVLRYAAKLRGAWDTQTAMAICRFFFNLGEFKEHEIRKAIKETRQIVGAEGKKLTHASPDAWKAFFEDELGTIKRDIFTGKLMFIGQNGLWDSARNAKDLLKAAAYIKTNNKLNLFAQEQVMNMLAWTESKMPMELCFDVPEWDGVDRIKMLSDSLTLTGANAIGALECCELVKDWCAKMFQRISDPMVRNRVLILKSAKQNIGKDWWIEALTGGLGQWETDLTIQRGDKDVFLQLSKKAVLNIAEFDKTAQWENATIKDMVTKTQTDIRASYDVDSKDRLPRASFIASCNVDDILRDHTGASRFIILEVESIDWSYPRDKESKAQIIGQCKALALENYKASKETERKLAQYLGERTPGDPVDDIVEAWDLGVAQWLESDGDTAAKKEAKERGWIENRYANEIIEKISKTIGFSPLQIKRKFSTRGMARRTGIVRGWVAKFPKDESVFF